jgi:cytochrome c oxidase subunit III
MSLRRSLDVSHLPDFAISDQAPLWWGQLMLALIEGTMFFILIAMYFYARLSLDVWPPPGVQLPQLTWETLALAPLLLSTAGSYISSEGAKQNDRTRMIGGMFLNLVMAGLFLGLRFWQWSRLNFNWKSDIHGSLFWTMMGLHTFDAVADLAFTTVLFVLAILGYSGPRQRLGIHVDSVVWYFIVLIWIPLYVTLYWGPRLIGTP